MWPVLRIAQQHPARQAAIMDAAANGDAAGEKPNSSTQREIGRTHAPGSADGRILPGGDPRAEDPGRLSPTPSSESSAQQQPQQPRSKKPAVRRQRRAPRRSWTARSQREEVLDSVDTNVLVVAKENETNGEPGLEHSTYAEAVKEGPVDTTPDGDASKGSDDMQTNGLAKPDTEHDMESDKIQSDVADTGATYADVVKEKVKDSEKTNGHVTHSSEKEEEQKEKGDSSDVPAAKKADSVANDYPELKDDGAVHEEEYERMRDRIAAAQVAGIRFAPLKVPLKRRMQTLAVLFHSLCMGTTVSIFFFLCALPFLWPIIIIYLITILFATDATDGRLRRRKEWFRRSMIWKYFAEYFPAKLHKTHDLPPTRKYIFGYHPHGIISHGAWVAFASEALGFAEKFPGITNSLLTLDSNFRTPIYREYVFSMGCLSVSKESITNTLTRGGPNGEGMGRAVTIVIGGARESLEAQPGRMKLILKERKGFIKLAIRTGADLVPVVAFGENELYDQLQPHQHPYLHKIQRHFLKVWKFTVPLLHGRGIFNYDVGLMPYRRPMNIVVGKPIMVAQNVNPDVNEVDRLHDVYTEEVQKIWDRYKDEFAKHRKEELQILD